MNASYHRYTCLFACYETTDHDEFDMKIMLRRPLADKAVMRRVRVWERLSLILLESKAGL